jgi:hypothetical protein
VAIVWHNRAIMQIASLDLQYLENDPRTQQPSASIYVKSGGDDAFAPERLITAPGLTFIELDAEIRRLHAELDEIRARARKKFYKAEAAAAAS